MSIEMPFAAHIRTKQKYLDELPIITGQLVFVEDKNTLFWDKDDVTRDEITDIVTIKTDEERLAIKSPVAKLYLVQSPTPALWAYDNGWKSISSSSSMSSAVYDPQGKAQDVFAYADAISKAKEGLLKDAAEKGSVTDGDMLATLDSTASNTTKTVKFSTLKAALKSYFDGLYNKYTHPTYTAKVSGLYKVAVDRTGHVSGSEAVTKADITGLGIPGQDTVYTLPAATASVLGGVKVGDGLTASEGVVSVGNVDGGTF